MYLSIGTLRNYVGFVVLIELMRKQAEAKQNNIYIFSPHLKKTRFHYKYQLVNAAYGNNCCLL
jgi:hypothetical protein